MSAYLALTYGYRNDDSDDDDERQREERPFCRCADVPDRVAEWTYKSRERFRADAAARVQRTAWSFVYTLDVRIK